ncbi:hypothetical protein [Streptomyces incanus]|uniref:Thiamine pyrophosphate enzyme central domain-containing protein n=1 Tax=Streptomyces incanus TaxID=887453 RepID=A0ABW0XWT6_9ACTN
MASPKNVPGHLSLAPQPFTVLPPGERLRAAAAVLNACERVAICAGAGAGASAGASAGARGAGEALEQVAEVLGAPIVKAALGKDCVPDDSPYTTGGMGLIGTRASHEAFETCDGFLIVAPPLRFTSSGPSRTRPRGADRPQR